MWSRKDSILIENNDAFLSIAPHLPPIEPNGKNLVFSPLSLRLVVNLLAAGASGPTLKQLLTFLKADSIDDVNTLSSKLFSKVLSNSGGPNISFANGVWIQDGLNLRHSFKQVAGNVYNASCFHVDFANREADEIIAELNSWAEEQTNGLINDVFRPECVNELTRIILANALCFKGKWFERYFELSKKEHKFHLLGGDSVKIPFMKSYHERHLIGTFDDFKILRILYERRKPDKRWFSMYILLPDLKHGLPALAEKVASEPDFLDRHLPRIWSVPVKRLRLPRFKISFGFTASDFLSKLGIPLLFESGGLTEIVDSDLTVARIDQKCFIEVNEEGTEAAVVTVAYGEDDAYSGSDDELEPIDFVANHPFMFMIREDTSGAVLFFGHVLNPLHE